MMEDQSISTIVVHVILFVWSFSIIIEEFAT